MRSGNVANVPSIANNAVGIADAHCDTLSIIAQHGFSAPRKITSETLRTGCVGFQLFALFCAAQAASPYQRAVEQLSAFRALCQEEIRPSAFPVMDDGFTRAMLSMEGCEALEGSIERLHEFYDAGVRVFGLTWNYENQLGGSAMRGGGSLKPFGLRAVREMARLGAAVDASHLSAEGFWDALETGIPLCCTHSNAAALCAHPRNLTDDQLRALFQADGFVGLNFYPKFLVESGEASIADVVHHALYMLELGGEGHIGFGSDFDGIEIWPGDLADPSDFPAVLNALAQAGLSSVQIENIASRSLMKFLRRALRHG